METEESLTLTDRILLAAFSLCGGDLKKKFTAEDLIIEAWRQDKSAFGLRNYENDHPDSNKLYTKLDGKDGLVIKGLFKKVADRTYILTEAGLSLAVSIKPVSEETQLKVDRGLYDALVKIINHKVFGEWLQDRERPKNFRDAAWFWGIAPGNPPKVVKGRLALIERTLEQAKRRADESSGKILLNSKNLNKEIKTILSKKGNSNIDEQKSKLYLDTRDIEWCIEFHETLKKRFGKELKIMLEKC